MTQATENQLQLTLPQAMELASRHQATGNLQQAEDIVRQLLQKQPKYAPAIHLLGVIAHQVGKTEQALKIIADAIALAPDQALFYTNYGEMSRSIGRLDDAISYGKKAVELAPDMAVAHSNLGIAYYDQKQLDQAEQCQQKALELNPKLAPAMNNLGSIKRERKEKEAAVEIYRQLVAKHPTYIEGISNLGATLSELEQYAEAREVLLGAIKQRPNYAEAHCNIGTTFIGLDQLDKAQVAFQTALKHKPDYPEALVGLAKVHKENHQLEQAEKAVRQALVFDPKSVSALATFAGVLMDTGYPERAEQVLQEALELDPDSTAALNAYGSLLLELGDLEKAEEVLLRSAEANPENALGAHLSMTLVKKAKAEDSHFLALIEAEKEIDAMPAKRAMALNFALGKSYDDMKEADKAFPYFAAACKAKREGINYSADNHSKFVELLKQTFSAEFFEKYRDVGSDSAVPIFVLGMPRSGTTLTEQIIASHSDVYGAGELPDMARLAQTQKPGTKDLYPINMKHFSAEDFKALGEKYVAGLRERSADSPHITDKMPANFQYLGLIHLALPNAKIVHIKRNPVDTCLSCFTKNFNRGQDFSYELTELGRHYVDYIEIMKHWREVLPEGAFYEVEYEQLVADNENQARSLIEYCGLPWDDACLESHKHERSVRTASVSQVRQPVYNSSVQRWLPYKDHLQPLLEVLGELVPEA